MTFIEYATTDVVGISLLAAATFCFVAGHINLSRGYGWQPLFNFSTQRVGGLRFVRLGMFSASFCLSGKGLDRIASR